MLLQHLQRHEQLAPRGIPRQRRHHLGHALRQSGVAREMFDPVGPAPGDPGAERKQRRRGIVDIAFQRRHGRHRIVVEIELMLVDQARQPLDRQVPVLDHKPQLGRNRIALDAAMAGAREHVGPPLQAHFAGQRLAHLLAHAGNLDIEGIQCQQRAAQAGRHEQGGCVTGKIVGPHQLSAEFGGTLVAVCDAHGTAISAAATRRRSPIMML